MGKGGEGRAATTTATATSSSSSSKATTPANPPLKVGLGGLTFDVENMSNGDAAALETFLRAGLAALQARAKARPVPPPPMAKPGASSDASFAARPKVDAKARGSIRPPEPKGPPPKRPQGSNRPAEPKRPPPETVSPKPKPKAKAEPQTPRVTTMFKTKSEWKGMRHRDGVAHVRRMRKFVPRGSVGQQIVGKQGPTYSTCTVRRRISTKAAQAYAASKRQRHDLPQPKSNSGQREGVLKGPDERKEPRVAKAKALAKEATTDDAEASDGGESVEPEAFESDREVEVETKEEPEVEEVKAHEDVAAEEYEDVFEEAAEEEAAESSKGQGKGHVASTGSRTGASPVGTTGDVGMTVSLSSAMHNLSVKSLSSILDGAMPEVGQVGGPDPHEEANFEEHHHNVLPSAKELYVKEPVIDANTGVELDPKKVAAARATEIAWVQRQKVYEKVDESTCYEETGKP